LEKQNSEINFVLVMHIIPWSLWEHSNDDVESMFVLFTYLPALMFHRDSTHERSARK